MKWMVIPQSGGVLQVSETKKYKCNVCHQWFDCFDMVDDVCTACYVINVEVDDDDELDEEYDDDSE